MDILTKYEKAHGRGCWSKLARAVKTLPTYISELRRTPARSPSLPLAFAIEDATNGEIPARYWADRQRGCE